MTAHDVGGARGGVGAGVGGCREGKTETLVLWWGGGDGGGVNNLTHANCFSSFCGFYL